MRTECCCCSMCCYADVSASCWCCPSSSAGWQKLLLWFIESDPRVFMLFIQENIFLYVPRGSTCRTYGLDLPITMYVLSNYGHVRSQGGSQPGVARIPFFKAQCYLVIVLYCRCHTIFHVTSATQNVNFNNKDRRVVAQSKRGAIFIRDSCFLSYGGCDVLAIRDNNRCWGHGKTVRNLLSSRRD